MDAARWHQIEGIYHAVLEQPVDRRTAYLNQACSDDADLLREVETLLEKDGSSGGPIDRPAWHGAVGLLENPSGIEMSPGRELGPYRIIGKLGSGGMGEVYEARDSRLNRSVAIKIARARFSERFEREARAIAALNHPNICSIHDVGPSYLVMELVDGPTLSDRLRKGPMPLAESLNVARQIASAMEAAHEKGIVHRDLKPANIKIKPDGTVKVLDFGLAKQQETPRVNADGSPSLESTETGLVLGTAGYMAPEQARGESVDRRADTWAFGVVLYQMLAGRRPFEGRSVAEVLAAVLKEEADLSKVPLKVRALIKSCLEKDAKKRLRDVGDAIRLLDHESDETSADSQGSGARRFPWLWPGVAAASLLAAAGLAYLHWGVTRAPAPKPITFQIIPSDAGRYLGFVLSPDGRRLAFSGPGLDGVTRTWVRNFDSLTVRAIPEAQGSLGLIWSPDSRSLAFVSGGKLRKVDAAGGQVEALCDWPSEGDSMTGDWNSEGDILFSLPNGGIGRISDGACTDIAKTGRFPAWLPDGKHFVYSVLNKARTEAKVMPDRSTRSRKSKPPIWL